MSAHRSCRLDRRTAERILNGDRTAGHRALRDLLDAAAAEGRDNEFRGERAAVAAFRAARLDPASVRRSSMIKTAWAKLHAVPKVAVAAAATVAVAVGGVAAVAATGSLPKVTGAPVASTSTTIATTSSVASSQAGEPSHTPPSTPIPSTPVPTGTLGAEPSPSLVGLCHAYTAGAGSEHGKALENPAFTVLITTAGGREKVDGYCAGLLGDHPGEGSGATTTERAVSGDPLQPRNDHSAGSR